MPAASTARIRWFHGPSPERRPKVTPRFHTMLRSRPKGPSASSGTWPQLRQAQHFQDPPLARLVGGEQQDGDGEADPQGHAAAGVRSWASTTASQRRQRPGCAALRPTSGSTRQQRAHLAPGARRELRR